MNNTNTKFWFNLEDHGAGKIFVTIAGKKLPLRYTLHQQEQLSSYYESMRQKVEELTRKAEDNLRKANEPTAEESSKPNQFFRINEHNRTICLIALNPQPEKCDFTSEDVENNLDLDQVKLLADYWLLRKVHEPKMAGEPVQGK